jgi:hypothetical protein
LHAASRCQQPLPPSRACSPSHLRNRSPSRSVPRAHQPRSAAALQQRAGALFLQPPPPSRGAHLSLGEVRLCASSPLLPRSFPARRKPPTPLHGWWGPLVPRFFLVHLPTRRAPSEPLRTCGANPGASRCLRFILADVAPKLHQTARRSCLRGVCRDIGLPRHRRTAAQPRRRATLAAGEHHP